MVGGQPYGYLSNPGAMMLGGKGKEKKKVDWEPIRLVVENEALGGHMARLGVECWGSSRIETLSSMRAMVRACDPITRVVVASAYGVGNVILGVKNSKK